MTAWEIWLLLAAIFIVMEIFTAGFAVACFSVGCVFGAIVAALSMSLTWQIVAFTAGTFLAFVFVRPFVMKYLDRKTNNNDVKTNMDNIIGKIAIVTERIEEGSCGRVKIDGDDWKAVTDNGLAADVGKKVRIISYESIILTVKKL